MHAVRIILAVVLTSVLFYVARNSSRGRPEEVSFSDNGYTFSMSTVPKITAFEFDTMRLRIAPKPPEGFHVVYKTTGENRGKETPLESFRVGPSTLYDLSTGEYFTSLKAGERGKREYYVFEVIDSTGVTAARFTQDDGSAFVLKYIGVVPIWVLGPHIVSLFITVFCIIYATFYAVSAISGNEEGLRPMARWLGFGTLATFIGGYPFGFLMNWYAFNGIWEGVPFGTDATDNKTQLLFVYVLFVSIASIGSLTNGKWGRNAFSTRALGWFGLGAFLLLPVIYLIPHSIQFSRELTYGVCYGFIGLVFLLYIVGKVTSRRQPSLS